MEQLPALDAAMDAFAAGDAGAFEAVATLGRPPLERALRRLTRDPVDAADLAQETLIRVLRAREHWRPGARFLPWAHTIARRLFLDGLRGRRNEQKLYDAIAHREALRAPIGPDEALAARRAAERLRQALAALPAGQRAVVEHIVLDGESVGATADRLGSAPVAIRVRLCRARRALAASVAL